MTTYHPELTEKEKEDADKLIGYIEEMTKNAGLQEFLLRVPSRGIVNWACAWNEISALNREVTVIASTGKLCLVIFHDATGLKANVMVYRNEDITPHMTKEKFEEAGKLAESLGLPTYKYPEQ